MSKPPIRGWLEPKPPMKLQGKPVAYVVANQSTSGLTHGKNQQRNYRKPVSEQLRQAPPTQSQSSKMPHILPQQYQGSYVPKPRISKTQESKPAMPNKVSQNKTRNNVQVVEVDNIIVQNIKHMNLNVPKPHVNTYKKPTTSQAASGSKSSLPKTTSDQKYTRRRPINNNGCVINITNNFINRK